MFALKIFTLVSLLLSTNATCFGRPKVSDATNAIAPATFSADEVVRLYPTEMIDLLGGVAQCQTYPVLQGSPTSDVVGTILLITDNVEDGTTLVNTVLPNQFATSPNGFALGQLTLPNGHHGCPFVLTRMQRAGAANTPEVERSSPDLAEVVSTMTIFQHPEHEFNTSGLWAFQHWILHEPTVWQLCGRDVIRRGDHQDLSWFNQIMDDLIPGSQLGPSSGFGRFSDAPKFSPEFCDRFGEADTENYNPMEKTSSRVSEVEMAHIGNSMERAEEIATLSLPDKDAPSSLLELLEALFPNARMIDLKHNLEMAKQSVLNRFGYQTYAQLLHTAEDVRLQALRASAECDEQAYKSTLIKEQAARLQALRNEEGMRRLQALRNEEGMRRLDALRKEEGMRRLGMHQVQNAIERRQRLAAAQTKASELLTNTGYEGRVERIANGRTYSYDVSNSLRQEADNSLALVKAAQNVHARDVDALENACRVVERMGRFDQLQTRDEKYDWQYDYGYQVVGNNMTPVAVY